MDKLFDIVNADQEFKEVGKDWEGDVLVRTYIDEECLKDLGDEGHMEALAKLLIPSVAKNPGGWKGTPMGRVMEEISGMSLEDLSKIKPGEIGQKLNLKEMGEKFSKLKPGDLLGVEFCVWIDLWHGGIRSPLEVVPSKAEKGTKFILAGPYASFKEFVSGKADAIELITSGKLELGGDMGYIMKRAKAVKRISDLLGMVPIEWK